MTKKLDETKLLCWKKCEFNIVNFYLQLQPIVAELVIRFTEAQQAAEPNNNNFTKMYCKKPGKLKKLALR